IMKFLITKTLLLALPGAAFAAPFGADLFQGGFSRSSVAKAYPEYLLKNGDTIEVSLFGSLQANYSLTVDAVGNVVIPKVGPIKVAGVKL
uniref:polysaccharide biosynthesis/export family protein n=1 Tax=Vibrio vulnificus TaxID=672 RepID=UPI0039B4DA4E